MKNIINLDRERKRQGKKLGIKRVREAWRTSILAGLREKFGNREVEKYMPYITEQIDTLEIDLFEKDNGKKAHQDGKSKQRSSVTSSSKTDISKNDKGSIQTSEKEV